MCPLSKDASVKKRHAGTLRVFNGKGKSGQACRHIEQDTEERHEELEAHDDGNIVIRVVMGKPADGEQRYERAQ